MSWKIARDSLKEIDLVNEESLFFLGNGYIGVRGNFEESYGRAVPTVRGTYLNAFHDVIDIPYGEKLFAFPETQQKMLNVIDTQTIHIYLGDEKEHFSIQEGEVKEYTRKLHMDEGKAERNIRWKSPLGKEIDVCFERMVSFVHRELFYIKVSVTPVNFNDVITIVSIMDGDVENFVDASDPRVGGGHAKLLHVQEADTIEESGFLRSRAESSGLEMACLSFHKGLDDKLVDISKEADDQRIIFTYQTQGRQEQPVEFSKWNIYVDDLRHSGELKQKAQRIRGQLETIDDFQLAKAQRKYLETFWERSDVEVDGDDDLQEGIRFNLYHLLQSAGRDKYSNITAKGLSGEGYEGHYFWDTEIYMVPVFLMTAPDLAKQLLIYRHSILDKARERAVEMGHRRGALFPWRTINGKECSSYFPAGTAQYHISADIAYSYIQYFLATRDESFLLDYGAEVLLETARLWVDMGHFRKDGTFAIDNVTGPDEYTCVVNNNYYTNSMAKYNLEWAYKIYQMIKEIDGNYFEILSERLNLWDKEVESFKRAAEAMYLPYDEELGIHAQDDTFLQKAVWDFENTPKEHYPLLLHYHPLTLYRYQVCKQADTVLSHFLLEDYADEETIHNSYNYYERVTTHDSSLSTCVFSMMASKLGDLEKGYQYFQGTTRLDLDNTHNNTKDGLHMANMGGTWMAIVYGFAGLRVKENGLHLDPKLPKQWNSYSFHIHYKGSPVKVKVTDEKVSLTLVEGEQVSLWVNGEEIQVKRNEQATLSY
ncbi:glycoside hydrolase family 65 protein [Thalassobacillus pellis]|uniref:glycoside hydrolase family 65 protein n=1 Tax=Thalassobacillus pellis TaxID=748008 RepID=UPI001962065F|nr:glycoside hydrolase family 65 protein [Thalassobacillus pellis]MBM7551838.1 alpha,alpha-trehalose phosphorylase [Thalassobacillus pellis]